MNFLESVEYFFNICKDFFDQLYSNDLMKDEEEVNFNIKCDVEPLS
jgi:hypothetical protein